MKEKIKTLVLYANSPPSGKQVISNTLLRGLLHIPDDYTPPSFLNHFKIGKKIINQFKSHYKSLGYIYDWIDAVCQNPDLNVSLCNITNLIEYYTYKKRISEYDLIIIMHSAAGDDMSLLLKTSHWFRKRRGELVVFIGNEYDIMREKYLFLRKTEADYVCSQLPFKTACWLYDDCAPTKVIPLPHALNPKIYKPIPKIKRKLDLGFIGAQFPVWIGDEERNDFLIEIKSVCQKYNLIIDIRTNTKNIAARKWADFLYSCKGTPGSESGSYYLDKNGDILNQAKSYMRKNPSITFNTIYDKFFLSPKVETRTGKCISSRHFEAIGTKTCQILLEGNYNGILKPGVHYFSIKKDYSNLDEILREFQDESRRSEIIRRSYEFVMDAHTYRHRIQYLISNVMGGN